ncbi:MAG: hypothetical protein HY903_06870 [Deltaproteobacteria bacterium]|nr:hypothetical protein [Deltaproteobacteria bacterium]
MRRLAIRASGLALPLLLATVLAPAAAHAALGVSYVAYEEETSWQPIWRDDVAKAIEEAALDEITRSGLLLLTRVPVDELAALQPEYLLRIIGRFVPEAETHTILISFEGGKTAAIGALRAAETVVIGKIPRAAMLERIEASTRSAATKLVGALKGAIARAQPDAPPPAVTDHDQLPPLPWKWAEVRIPEASTAHAGLLFGKDEDKRQAALRELTSLALNHDAPRHVLERCVLSHQDPKVRLGCLVALRPLSRRLQPTQRVVIEALRQDDDRRVIEEANDQMTYFTGVSKAEAIQAWLERTAKEGTAYGPLKTLGDLPNLDSIVVQCLTHSAKQPEYKRSKTSCIELLAPVPYKRRRAILWPFLAERRPDSPRYLEGAGEREGSLGTEWHQAIDALTDVSCGVDQAFEDVLWQRYEQRISSAALDALTECGLPSKGLADRLLKAFQTSGTHVVLSGLKRVSKGGPEIKARVRDKLAEFQATNAYRKSDRGGVSPRDLEDALKELAKEP